MAEEIRFCTVLSVRFAAADPGVERPDEQFLADLAAMLNMVCVQFAGEDLRSVADTCLYAFARADDAARAACQMQREAKCQEELTERRVDLRIGLDAGDMEKVAGTWRGQPLLRSTRVSSLAPPATILAAADLRSYLGRSLRQRLRPFAAAAADTERLGCSLYELPWERADGDAQRRAPELLVGTPTLTFPGADGRSVPGRLDVEAVRRVLPLPQGMTEDGADPAQAAVPPAAPPEPRLCLIRGRRLIVVDARSPRASIGRSPDVDLQIDIDTASRKHADVTYSGGRFLLTDHSWNGTYVYDAKGVGQMVHNDHLELPEEGYVCPGTPEVNETTSFRFRRADAPRTNAEE